MIDGHIWDAFTRNLGTAMATKRNGGISWETFVAVAAISAPDNESQWEMINLAREQEWLIEYRDANGLLRLTTAKYYDPFGEDYQEQKRIILDRLSAAKHKGASMRSLTESNAALRRRVLAQLEEDGEIEKASSGRYFIGGGS